MATKKAPTKAAAKKAPAKKVRAKKAAVKKPQGRPSMYSDALVDKLLGELANGKSLRTVCKKPGMPSVTTVVKWLGDQSKPGFSLQYARAREAQAEVLADEIVEIADEVSATSSEAIAKARLRVDARKWYASKLAPKRFGDKLGIGGADDLPPIDVKPQMNDAETAVHLAKILASAGTDIAGLLKK